MAHTVPAELNAHMAMYCFDVTRATMCAPSYLVFMSVFSPSRYESKLWDLRHFVMGEKKQTLSKNLGGQAAQTEAVSHLKAELGALSARYRDLTSNRFDGFLHQMLAKKVDGKTRAEQANKYWYYVNSSIDWELIRVQPLRYMWNTSDTLTLYAVLLTGLATAAGKERKEALASFETMIKKTDTGQALQRLRKYTSAVPSIPPIPR